MSLYLGKTIIIIKVGNGYLQYDITVRNGDDSNFANADVIRLVNNAFAYTFKHASISTHKPGRIRNRN